MSATDRHAHLGGTSAAVGSGDDRGEMIGGEDDMRLDVLMMAVSVTKS